VNNFLASALAGGEWSVSRPGHFTPEEKASGTHWRGGWEGPRVGLDDAVNRRYLTPPRLGPPARSQSLYRVSARFGSRLEHQIFSL
jgi:hypothetical protein